MSNFLERQAAAASARINAKSKAKTDAMRRLAAVPGVAKDMADLAKHFGIPDEAGKPRIQHMFMSIEIDGEVIWHV